MTRAYEWDGIGPKEECLLRIDGEWIHVQFREVDLDVEEGYYSLANEVLVFIDTDYFSKTYMQYVTKGTGYTITHYAALPTIPRVIDLTERIRNDADEGAATV